jgi:ubiquinone/menaquinone biosynthesis C-methylase UbiE
MLQVFSELVESAGGGPVADLGCGTGMVTGHLRALGMDVFGVDLSPSMLALARQALPQVGFVEGAMEALPLGDGTVDGAVANYSIIHTDPVRLPLVCAEFARVLRPGGHLLIGFQSTEDAANEVEAFDHAVITAYKYAVDYVSNLLIGRGFREIARLVRQPAEGERFEHVYLLAAKAPSDSTLA